MTTRLSIVIINYNTKKLVLDCLQSIKASTGIDFGIKIIVVDNSFEFKKILGITLITSSGNIGFSAGNNLATKDLVGDYVWYLNPDTTVDPDTISFMVNYMDTHPDVGVATPKLLLPDGIFDKNCHRSFPTIWNSFCHFSGLDKLFPKSKLFSGYYLGFKPIATETEVDVVGGSSLLTRVNLAKQIGWWDEDYFMYGEDIEFTYRIKQLGFKVMFVPDVIIHHYHGASSGLKKTSTNISKADSETKLRSILATTNAMRIFYRKHTASKTPWLLNQLVYFGIFLLERYRQLILSA